MSGAIFNPIVLYSEFILYTTGKGLDPGPGGLYGALEGIGMPFFRVSMSVALFTLWYIVVKVTDLEGL